MTTRYNIPYQEGKAQLDTGYDLQNNDPSTFYIPSCGIEDVDAAIHALFDKDIPFKTYQANTTYEKEINLKKPFVVLATGERFALAKRLKPFRDRAGVLLLPAISIRRTTIEQASGDTFVGELTIKRRLDASDKDYQSLINRLLLKNVPNPPDTTRGNKGENQNDPSIREGMLLDNKTNRLRADHIYEIIAIPFPQFFTVTYEIVFWTNYTQHMNYLLETMLASQIVPGKGFYLKSDKGYWFSATVDSGLTAQDNFDDITDQERLIKYSFNVTVRGYLLAPSGPGQKVPFKRYLSNVNISFETYIADGNVLEQPAINQYNETKNDFTKENPYVLTDIEQDPTTKQKPTEQEKLIFERVYRDPTNQNVKQTKYVKQMANNQKQGETVYTASDQQALFDFFVDNE